MAAEDCLASDDDKLVVAGDVRGRRDDVLKLVRKQLDHLSHDAPALRLAEKAGERRVLAEVVVVLALVHECLAYLGNRSIQQAFPPVGVVLVDPPLISPPKKHVPCFFNRRFAKSPRDRLMVSEAACVGTLVAASLRVLFEVPKTEALRRLALTDQRGGQRVSAIALRTVGLHGLVQVE